MSLTSDLQLFLLTSDDGVGRCLPSSSRQDAVQSTQRGDGFWRQGFHLWNSGLSERGMAGRTLSAFGNTLVIGNQNQWKVGKLTGTHLPFAKWGCGTQEKHQFWPTTKIQSHQQDTQLTTMNSRTCIPPRKGKSQVIKSTTKAARKLVLLQLLFPECTLKLETPSAGILCVTQCRDRPCILSTGSHSSQGQSHVLLGP